MITSRCYEDRAYEAPHVPEIFEKNLAALEKKKSEKGELYKKMRSMYENSLPVSLAFYASDKRSKEWNREHFATKVEQRAYFECLCGGTEEGRRTGMCYLQKLRALVDTYYLIRRCWLQSPVL